jgi:hypothetical protein
MGGYGLSGWGDPWVVTNDAFDALLNNTCAVYRITGNSLNSYGNALRLPFLIAEGIPCRISALGGRSPHPGAEYKVQKQLPITDYKIFMRQQHFVIDPAKSIVLESRLFNIKSVLAERYRDNNAVHHLEIFVEEVLPSLFTPTPVRSMPV